MASLITKHSPGNQAADIRAAFSPQSMAGLSGLQGHPGMDGVWSDIVNATSSFVQSRWGQQRGTIAYDPVTGQIIQKQAAGVPIQTQAPVIYGGQSTTSIQGPEGFATGLASGTTIALLIGGVIVVMMLTKR